jgi:hypothetical protein
LENWIADVGSDLNLPNLPIVIGGIGGKGTAAGTAELEMRQIQQTVVANAQNTFFTDTAQFVTDKKVRNDFLWCDEDFHYWCNAEVMVNIGRQFATDMLTLIDDALPVATPSPPPSSAEDPAPCSNPN